MAAASPVAENRSRSLIDPAALMRIKSMQLRAKTVVEGVFSGLHRSPFRGFSVEFSEYRPYTAGDDTRYLDWRLLARTDRCYIKQFEEETNLRCHLLVDLSRSMGYGSLGYSKADYAKTAAATLAYYLAKQRDCVGLVAFDEQINEYLPARYRPGHMHRIMLCLERSLGGTSTNLAAPLEQIARTVAKRGLIVLLSDLLAPLDQLETNLGYLRSRGHEVVVMRVLDPAEMNFSFDKPAMFHDMESGRRIYVDPTSARARYLERFAAHSASLAKICGDLGVDLHPLPTNRPLELALLDFLKSRERRGRQIRRAAPRTGGSRAPQSSRGKVTSTRSAAS